MSELVLRRKEINALHKLPIPRNIFNYEDMRYLVCQRKKYEYRMRCRNKKKTDFINYANFLKSIIKHIKKLNNDSETSELINLHYIKIVSVYHMALKYFINDLSLWKKYIKFLIKAKQLSIVQKVLNRVLLLHGHISDSLYVFVVKVEIEILKNIQTARSMYISGLKVHMNSSSLYFEAFKCELTNSKALIQELLKSGKEIHPDNPVLRINVSIAKLIFEAAVENVKNDTDLFFQMHQAASQYNFSLDLSKEIKKFMSTTFTMNTNYWNTLAKNELLNKTNSNRTAKIIKFLQKYNAALSIFDTDEVWDKYLTTMIEIISDTRLIEIYKIIIIKEFMHDAHKKNKLKPNHYIQLINNSKSSVTHDILDWAIEAYPNDTSISEINIKFKLTDKDELIAYELFKENANQVSPNFWLTIVEHFSNKPQISHIFNMAFGDESVCTNEVKIKLANVYLLWLGKNKSLNDARNAYLLLTTNNSCDASLCKTLVTLETEQQIIDIIKIRQHFTLACMQFGRTDVDLWMKRIYFELKYGSPKLVSTTYYQALTTLNNEESDKFAEQYILEVYKII